MSDLSRLLEDVYSSSAAPPDEARDEAPAWSSEEALEQVFAEWVPGPPEEAPAQERAMFADADEVPTMAEEPVDWEAAIAAIAAIAPQAVDEDVEPETETVPLIDHEHDSASMSFGAFELFESIIGDMPKHGPEASDTDAFIAALESDLEDEDVPVAALAVAVAPSPSGGWCRDDDDILPIRSARRFRLTLRR